MKKICVVTSEESFRNNYGAALQGYALCETLKKMGYTPLVLRYQGGMPQPQVKFKGLRKVKFLLGRTKRQILFRIRNHQEIKYERKYKRQIEKREEYFCNFADSKFAFINDKRESWFDIKENPPHADIYLCGSDQIWNPFFKNGRNDLGYFLDFAPMNKPRIAYAPSFGCSELPDPAKSNISELLSKFKAVSIREEAGSHIIKKETGMNVPVVADPTLLFTSQEWETVEKKVDGVPEKYILCYRFSDNPETKKSIDDISQKLDIPVVTLPLSVPALGDKNYQQVFNAGPAEFVWLIHHATLVCTDSFHATVFSLLFHTPFLVFLRENFAGNSGNMNSRIENLMSIACSNNRVVTGELITSDVDEILNMSFSNFDENVRHLRESSLKWLGDALGD